jgi:Tol biopolymer transport system component
MNGNSPNRNWALRICALLLLSLAGAVSCAPPHLPRAYEGGIAFASDRNGGPFGPLYIMDADGRPWRALANTRPASPGAMTWSPDGTTLAFEAVLLDDTEYRGVRGIVFVGVGGDENRHTEYGPCRHSPAWSPDGRLLAFYTDCDGRSSLSIATPERTGETELVTNLPERVIDGTEYPIRISWSPDSRFLIYDVRDEEGNWDIWAVSQDGEFNRFVTDGQEPAWSPARDEIAFEREGDIWLLSMETGEEFKLVDDPVRAHWPAWSPSGDQLLFVSWRDDQKGVRRTMIRNTEIYRIDRDGSGLVNLTRNDAWDAYPVWRPTSAD